MEINSEITKDTCLLCEAVRNIVVVGNVFIKCRCLASVWICKAVTERLSVHFLKKRQSCGRHFTPD